MSDFSYPLSDNELEFENSVTQEFVTDTHSEFAFGEEEFEFDAPDVLFRPSFYPNRVSVGKERDIIREKGICRNEYVKDVGTKNREVHVVGYVTAYSDPTIDKDNYKNNLQCFHDMCDFGQRGQLMTMQWSGEVLLHDSDLEGPVGVDPETNHFLYEYTLDFVSTGASEMGVSTTGILNEGN